ncbi:MAG: NUDIX hydrolase [Candidatus Pacebacteria bacterium]|nr:NUDIX hydrolase [Candidatus Paceibacterota bacterium]
MKKRPDVTVKMMLRYKDEVLMVKHKDGHFGFPGGHVEWEESLFGALKRELREELNYNLKKEPKLFDVWNYIPKENPGATHKGHTVFLNYILKLNKKPVLSSPEKLGIFWLKRKDIVKMNIVRDKQFLDKVFKKIMDRYIN